MLGRLGLVIHILSWFLGIAALISIYLLGRYDITNYHVAAAASPFAGWATRFILSGHKSPLPWVANKETNND